MPIPILTAIFGLSAGLSLIGLLGHIDLGPDARRRPWGRCSASESGSTTRCSSSPATAGSWPRATTSRSRRPGRRRPPAAPCSSPASTVVIALLSLYFSGLPIVRALGYSSAIVVAVAVVTALTLLPAVLGLLGERINSLKLPFGGHPHDDQPHGWARWARGVGKRPWSAAIAGLAILIALALPLLDITLGQPDNDLFPKDTADQAVLRHPHRGLRRGDQRAAARLGQARPAGQARHEEAQPGRGQAAEAGAAGAGAVRGAGPAGGPRRGAAAARAGRADPRAAAAAEAAGAVPQVGRERPAPDQAQQPDRQGPGRRHRLVPVGEQRRHRRRHQRDPELRAVFGAHGRPRQPAPRRHDPEGARLPVGDEGLRRRQHRRLHRPGRSDRARSCRW